MKHKIPGIFVPDDMVAAGLLLVGYKLFPAASIDLHSRMTVLSGNNAVGKTTILDAVQTILVCHQHYINLNVATGQFDRSLSGQLSGRVGWAVLCVSGHSEVTALGVRLHARATSEGLDLNPFVITGVEPGLDMFIDRDQSLITPDFQTLKKNILKLDIQAQVNDFSSVDEYHRYLFAQGLLPVTMDRQGKKKFATLWSQVTRPKLDRLGIFLKEMLCPDPSQGIKFSDVEKLMRDRRSLSNQIKAIKVFRETRTELEEHRANLDRNRYLYLSTELGMTRMRTDSLNQKTEKEKQRETRTVQELGGIEKTLEQLNADKAGINAERDKYLGRQTELSRQQRHYEEYTSFVREKKRLEELLDNLSQNSAGKKEYQESLLSEIARNKSIVSEQESGLAAVKERLKYLKIDKDKYEDLQAKLGQSEKKTGKKIKSWADLHEAWINSQKEKARLDSLPVLKDRLKELEKRVALRGQAKDLVAWFRQNYPDISALSDENREEFDLVIRDWENLDFETPMAEVGTRLEKISTQIRKLEKGRPGLPEALNKYVDSGQVDLMAAKYEHLDMEKAARVQAGLGPFARGMVVDDLEKLANLDLGDEEFLLVNQAVDPKTLGIFDTISGTVAGQGDFYWYSPASPVWLGAQARARELARLGREKESLITRLEEIRNERLKNTRRLNRARELTGLWSGLEDKSCDKEFELLKTEISSLQKQTSAIQEKYIYLSALTGRKDHFDLEDAPALFKKTHKTARKIESGLEDLKKKLAGQEKELEKSSLELSKLDHEYAQGDKKLTRIMVSMENLEKEEPMDVLLGKIDFSRAVDLREKISSLDRQIKAIDKNRDKLIHDRGDKSRFLSQIQHHLDVYEKEIRACRETQEKRLAQWENYYPGREPEYRSGSFTKDDSSMLKSRWIQTEQYLDKLINQISAEHSLQLPHDASAEIRVDLILNNIIPPSLELDRVEEQFQRLQRELGEIESRIRSYVQDIRQKVDQEIAKLKRRLDKVNTILADIRFGRISQVKIDLKYLPPYEGLKKLKGDKLSLLNFENKTTLEEFVQELIKNIFRHAQARVSEEQIADYRTYIDLSWSITDLDGEVRQKGFSGGETLGINLAICLGLLFHWGGESGRTQRGLLIMALDEAERLDEQAVNTVRELLDRVKCQLLVALPRTMRVPHTLCHMLTPLPEGVTHVSVYHKG